MTAVSRLGPLNDAGIEPTLTDAYADFLATLARRKLAFVPNPGNAGDELLRMGNAFLIKQLGITITWNLAEADVFVTQGGNPAMWFPSYAKMWRYYLDSNPRAKLVIAPSTYRPDYPDWMKFMREYETRIAAAFARDLVSLDALRGQAAGRGFTIGFGHDPAVHLRTHPEIEALRRAGTEDYVLLALRTDAREGLPPARGARGVLERRAPWPLSAWLRKRRFAAVRSEEKRKALTVARSDLPVNEQDVSMQNPLMFAELVRGAAEVHTNRLHAMIMACLLGKKTFAYSTSYGKLEAVYDSSIRSWAEVTFIC